MYALTPMNDARNSYPYEHLRRQGLQILEVNEVTTDALLSTGTSSITQSTTLLNPKILAPTGSRTQDLRCY